MDQDIGGAIAALKKHGLETLPPLGIVLGSGLGPFADEATDAVGVAYTRDPRLSASQRRRPCGRFVVGEIEGKRVALFQGRGHYYERGDAAPCGSRSRRSRRLGGETLLLTNAAGGLNIDWAPPALVAITDHINFVGDESADRPCRRRPLRAADPRL